MRNLKSIGKLNKIIHLLGGKLVMDKYIRFIKCSGVVEEEVTKYSYDVGETISVNERDNIYKCVDVITEKDKVIHCFKQGYKTYNFDW